jgi:hypothetical protein
MPSTTELALDLVVMLKRLLVEIDENDNENDQGLSMNNPVVKEAEALVQEYSRLLKENY